MDQDIGKGRMESQSPIWFAVFNLFGGQNIFNKDGRAILHSEILYAVVIQFYERNEGEKRHVIF